MKSFRIGSQTIGHDQPVHIIAEVGINHGGNVEAAARMIEAAAHSGANSVKLQTVDADASYLPDTPSYREFKGKELSAEALVGLMRLSRDLGVELFSTPGDFPSLDLILKVGMPAIKVSSGLLTNTPLVAACARSGLPLILSTGMARADEVKAAVDLVRREGNTALAVLQCVAIYPAPPEIVNLRAMDALRRLVDAPVGYSDHCLGELACIAAAAAGACVIEKHFTLDTSVPGADHAISADAAEMRRIVDGVRTVSAMLGDGVKRPTPDEERLRSGRHRYLVVRRPVKAGAAIGVEDIAPMRTLPGVGIMTAEYYGRCLGLRARQDLDPGAPLAPHMVEGMD